MENLIFFLIFLFIVGINLLAKNKEFLKKLSEKNYYGGKKTVPKIHKHVRNYQKIFRKETKKNYSAVLPQRIAEINSENSSNKYGLNTVYSQSKQKMQNINLKNYESFLTKKFENSTEKKFIFNPESMKDAVILKEILDAPLALR